MGMSYLESECQGLYGCRCGCKYGTHLARRDSEAWFPPTSEMPRWLSWCTTSQVRRWSHCDVMFKSSLLLELLWRQVLFCGVLWLGSYWWLRWEVGIWQCLPDKSWIYMYILRRSWLIREHDVVWGLARIVYLCNQGNNNHPNFELSSIEFPCILLLHTLQ